MAEMKSFVSWFLSELPVFLTSEPICYLVGFLFLAITIRLFRMIIKPL